MFYTVHCHQSNYLIFHIIQHRTILLSVSFNITATSCVLLLYRVACKCNFTILFVFVWFGFGTNLFCVVWECTFTSFWGAKNQFCVGWDSISICVPECLDLLTRFCPAWLRFINFSSFWFDPPLHSFHFFPPISFWHEPLNLPFFFTTSISLSSPSQNRKAPNLLVHVNTVPIRSLGQIYPLPVLGSRLKQF